MNTENDTQSTQTMNNTAGQPAADPGQVTANAANPAPPAPEPAPPPQPFDRQPGESEKAFAAFRIYLELGPTRSIVGACRHLGLKPGSFNDWPSHFQWRTRAAAYEEHLARLRRQAQEEALRQHTINWTHRIRIGHEQQWELAQDILDALRQLLAATRAKPTRDIRLTEVVRSARWVAKLHREAAGLDQPPPPPPPSPDDGLPKSFMASLRRIYGDAKPRSAQPTPASPDSANAAKPADTGSFSPNSSVGGNTNSQAPAAQAPTQENT